MNLMNEIIPCETDLIYSLNESQAINLDISNDFETSKNIAFVENLFNDNYLNFERPDKPDISLNAEISLKENKIISCSPQRFSEKERNILNEIIEGMLEKK
jgi:hypothetical protein